MAATPERIELENRRKEEEVPEEVQNRVNLSQGVHVSSEEEEDEGPGCEEEEDEGPGCEEEEDEGPGCVTSQEVNASRWETLREEEEEEEGSAEDESSDEGEYSPWETERRSGLWLLLEEEAEFPPPGPPVQRGSAPSSLTPPTAPTPSTASFVTSSDSTPDADITNTPLSPVVVMETAAQKRPTAGGRGSFDDITPELPQKKPLIQQEDREAEPEEEEEELGGVRRRSHRDGPPPTRPLLPGGGALLLRLKKLREAPPTGQVELGGGGARGLLKAVLPGNRKEQKRRGGTLPAEKSRRLPTNHSRDTVAGEESTLESSTLLQRCLLKPGNNLQLQLFDLVSELQKVSVEEEEDEEENQQVYVPHALAFRRSYGVKRKKRVRDSVPDSDGQSSCPTEVLGVLVPPKEPSSLSVTETMFQKQEGDEDGDLDAKITRRVQRAARRQAKKEQLKRLHKAQMIQRQLQQVEVKQRELEERGVMVEKALRGEADYWEDSSHGPDTELHLGGLGKLDNLVLMQQWFRLVQQKNSLVRYESELMIFARELQLEDRQSRLQQELRERMAVDDHLKGEEQLGEERRILEEMLEVVEQRDALVALLEEQRLLDRQQDQNLEVLLAGALSWA